MTKARMKGRNEILQRFFQQEKIVPKLENYIKSSKFKK